MRKTMTDEQTIIAETQYPANLPNYPHEGTTGYPPERELAIAVRCIDDDLRELSFAANQLDSGCSDDSDRFRAQMCASIRIRLGTIKHALDRIERLVGVIEPDAEQLAGELSVEHVMGEADQ
jgi:hypothetical protein